MAARNSRVIRIPNKVYDRLSQHAAGFETPGAVIEKILDQFEKDHPDGLSKEDQA